MSWTNVTTYGSGELAFRLEVVGWPYQFVTHRALENISATQPRYEGLDLGGVRLTQRVDPVAAKLDAGGMTVKVIDLNGKASLAFGKRPQNTTWLRSDATTSATSIAVQSVAGFPSSGTIWLDTEAITYTSTTASPASFDSCTRGAFSTLAQAHYVADGVGKRYPAITDWPAILQGRRVKLYAYGADDDPQGNGTQIWLGVAVTDPSYNGTTWSFSCDSIASILDADISSDLETPAKPRGIYFPWNRPFSVSLFLGTGSAFGVAVDIKSIKFPILDTDTAFFETNEDFCEYLNTKIATATSTWDSKLYAVSDGDQGWHFELQTGTTVKAAWPSMDDPRTGLVFAFDAVNEDGTAALSVAASTRYLFYIRDSSVSAPTSTPRGSHGFTESDSAFPATLAGTFKDSWIYIDRSTSLTNVTAASVSWKENGSSTSGDQNMRVLSIDSATNKLDLGRPLAARADYYHFWTGANIPEIRFGRSYIAAPGVGSVWDFLQAVYNGTAASLNLGSQPDIQSTDFATSDWSSLYGSGLPSLVTARRFFSFAPATLSDIVREELKLAGFFLALDPLGKITVKRLRVPVAGEAGAFSITELLTDKSIVTVERAGNGLFNTVRLLTGYNSTEDKHEGPTYSVRDVAAFGQSPATRASEIKPLSEYAGDRESINDIVELAARIFSMLGGSYTMATFDVPLRKFAIYVGDVVSVSSEFLPEDDGTRGVTSKAGLVLGRDVDLMNARVRLTVLFASTRAIGYAPAAKVTSQTNIAGNQWSITVDTAHFETSITASSYFIANDKVRVYKWDDTVIGEVTGTVNSSSGNVVTVTFDSVWTPSTSTWVLAYDNADTPVQSSQQKYAYMASSTGRIAFSSAVPAYTFS